jgi:hypothetical protein
MIFFIEDASNSRAVWQGHYPCSGIGGGPYGRWRLLSPISLYSADPLWLLALGAPGPPGSLQTSCH